MAGITQVIPTYVGGMSEQPDHTKSPGQVKNIINGIPDVTYGLFKRPGSKRVGTDPLTNVQSGGSWFHYYRDEAEGSYIGQVDSTGNVRIWKASGDNAGAEQTIVYGTGGEAAIKTYLSASNTEDIQALTINDTTFFNNRSIAVTTTGTTDTRLISTGKPENQAYIELRRTENGRQYGFNVSRPNETATVDLRRATRLKIKSDTLQEGADTGNCPGIGTQVFSVSAASNYTGTTTVSVKDSDGNDLTTGKDDLIFRLITLGQVSTVEGDTSSFQCTYNREIDLLHGGEGWAVGDTVTVTLDQAKGGGGTGTDDATKANYTIEVEEIETAKVVADVKLVRPTPTPFDSDTAVTADTILGGLQAQFDGVTVNDADGLNPESLNVQIIGNGLFFSCVNPFDIEVAEQDLMRVMQETINDVTELPNQCKDGYIVKVANARMSDEDDYYLKFTGDNGDGTGAWSECAAPNIVKSFDASTMPHVIQRTSIANQGTSSELATFTVKQFTWGDRAVGDDETNPIPTFVSVLNGHPNWESVADNDNRYISKVLFFRNRLAILSGENVVLCKPGTLASPDFWAETALTTSSVDPIDIACSSIFPSNLFDGIEINTGLLVFSSNQQFLLSSDDTVLNPDTAKLRSIATYNYSVDIPPISLGTTVGYVDNSGKYSRFNQMTNITREGEPTVAEVSKVVPSLLPKDIDIITNSRENQIVLLGKTGSDIIYGLKYFNTAEKQIQTAWFKWKLNNNLLYHFIIDDVYYYLDEDHFLQTINLVQSETDISINKDDVNYQIHLDNYVTGITGGSFNTNANTTTFYADWISKVTTPNGSLVIADGTSRYATGTVNGDYVTVNGDWSDTTSTHFSVTDYNEYIDTFFGANTSNIRSDKGVTFDGSTLSVTFKYSGSGAASEEWGAYSSLGFEKNIQCSAQYVDNGNNLTSAFGLSDNPPEKFRGIGLPGGGELEQIDYNWTLSNSSAGIWISGSSAIASSNIQVYTDDPAVSQFLYNLYNPTRITTNVEPLDIYKPDTDVFKITYDGEYVRWYQNGREKHRVARSVGNKLYFDSNLNALEQFGGVTVSTAALKNVKFESLTPGYALGYLYDYQVDFPTLYVSTSRGEVTRTDVNASLTLHRLNFNFGKVGSYETTLTRLGKDPYTEIYESTDTNLYEASDAPYLEEAIKTIPVYERNKNVDITLKSTSPTPATLHSMSWEGDYTTKYYKRV